MFGDGPTICGHRGAPVAEPENTIAGFEAAIDRGATWVEFDVRPVADGLVVHHDPADAQGRRLADLAVADLDPTVPTLSQVIDRFADRIGFDIELKSDDIGMEHDRYVETVLGSLGPDAAVGAFPCGSIVTSFDADLIAAFGRAAPGYDTGLLFEFESVDAVLATAVQAGHVAVGPWHSRVDDDLVDRARAHGLGVFTWTVNDPADVARVAAAGVDMIIGDDPALIAATLNGN